MVDISSGDDSAHGDQSERLQQQLEDKINELSDAKSQVMKLRKTMLQQLTSIGNITRPLFDLDREYFGGKFQDREDGSNPFQEVQLAVEVVNAAREHFSGRGAMGDSPELRDQLASMVEALEGLRDTVLVMRRDGLTAVGLPVQDSGFRARAFPDNDPVASIVDAAGLVHEIHGVCQRTAGRIKALVAMRDDADEVRGQAEDELEEFKTSPALIAETARRETEILQGELNALRIAMAEMQEQQGTRSQRASAEASESTTGHAVDNTVLVHALQDELERMQSDRMEDMAEVRSLTGDISMFAGELSENLDNSALDAAREQLKILLAGDAEIGVMAGAAETVFLRLAESLQQHIKDISNDLESLAGEHEKATAAEGASAADVEALSVSRREAESLRAEVQQLQDDLTQTSSDRESLQQQIEASGQSAGALECELKDARQAHQEVTTQCQQANQRIEALEQKIEGAQNELAASREALEETEEELTTLGDDKRSLKLELAEVEAQQRLLNESLQAHSAAAQQENERARSASLSAQEGSANEITRMQDTIRGLEQERLEAKDARAQHSHESSENQSRLSLLENEKDTAESSMRAHQQHSAELEKKISKLQETIADRDQQLREQESKTLEISRDRDQASRDRDHLQSELNDANARAAHSTADADRVQTESGEALGKLKAQLSQQAEGRRHSEVQANEEKRQFEDESDVLKKLLQELQEQHAEQGKELKSVLRDYSNEKQARIKKEKDATTRVKEAQAEVERYRKERASQDELISQAQGVKKDANSSLESKDQDLDKLRNARDVMQRQMSEANRQTQAMEERQRQLLTDHKEAETAWEQQRIASEKERQDLAIRISDLENVLSDNRSATAQLESDHDQQNDLVRRMTSEFDEMQEKVTNRNNEVDSLGRQLERVQKDLSKMVLSRDQVANELAQTEASDETQKKAIANLNRQLRDESRMHESKVDGLKELLNSAREQLQAARGMHEELFQTDKEIIAELMEKLKNK